MPGSMANAAGVAHYLELLVLSSQYCLVAPRSRSCPSESRQIWVEGIQRYLSCSVLKHSG
jgi:hypothetical protein